MNPRIASSVPIAIWVLLVTWTMSLTGRAAEYTGYGLCRFKLEGYELPAATEHALNAAVRNALDQHRKVFRFQTRPDFNVKMRIFGRYEDYAAFTLRHRRASALARHYGSVSNLTGYYDPAQAEIVTWRQAQPDSLANTLLHEASHAIMSAHYRRIPVWLSEGCATYFSFPPELQDDYDVDSLTYRWAKLNLWLRDKKLPAVTHFVNVTRREWGTVDAARDYTVSWSLFQFLMNSPANQDILRQLIQELQPARGRDGDCAALLARLYPGGITQFEQRWHQWIAQRGRRILGPRFEKILERVQPHG